MACSTCTLSADDDRGLLEASRTQTPERRRCQFCKGLRDCRFGPDPCLLLQFDEIEMVWLCDDCYRLRERGDHLPGDAA